MVPKIKGSAYYEMQKREQDIAQVEIDKAQAVIDERLREARKSIRLLAAIKKGKLLKLEKPKKPPKHKKRMFVPHVDGKVGPISRRRQVQLAHQVEGRCPCGGKKAKKKNGTKSYYCKECLIFRRKIDAKRRAANKEKLRGKEGNSSGSAVADQTD